MIEGLVAVTFAFVIVVGMATGQVWSRVVSEGMPLVRRWLTARLDAEAWGVPLQRASADREALIRRIDNLEREVEFLEALLEGGDAPKS